MSAGGRHLIAKEFLKPAEHATAPRREHGALGRLVDLDIAPRPVLIAAATTALGPLVVYEYLEGTPWQRRRPTAGQLRRLADTWAALHSAPADDLWPSRASETTLDQVETMLGEGFRAYADWVATAYPAGRRGLDLCLEATGRLRPARVELAEHEPIRCFCRSDARFANLIDRPDGRVGMIDWEDSGLGDPALDLADLTVHPNQEDLLAPDDLSAFLDRYVTQRGALDRQLGRRTQLYVAALSVLWLAWLLPSGVRRAEAGRLDGWTVNGLSPNQRLRRYLARALAWPKPDSSAEHDSLVGVSFFPDGRGA